VSLESLSLENLRVLVTGAGTGLGRQMALGLAEAGADLILCGRRPELLEATAVHVAELGTGVQCITADLTNEDDVADLVRSAGQVDVLVNNAGVSRMQSWSTVALAEWRALMALNVDAPLRLCQLLVPPMIERGWGRVINIGSVYGVQSGDGRNYPGVDWDLPGYVVSKHALVGLTTYLATAVAAHGVAVNMISPGMFVTEGNTHNLSPETKSRLAERTPTQRMGSHDDLQAAVVFLASPGAKFVTGQNLVVDGGWTLW